MHLNPSRWSIRSQLLSLVLLCLLPAVGLSARFLLDLAAQAREQADRELLFQAQATAADIGRVVSDGRLLLERLAAHADVRAMDPGRCDPIFRDFGDTHPGYTTLSLRRTDASSVCSFLQPPPSPQSVAEAPWFRDGLAAGGLHVGDAYRGRITLRWTATLTHPVRDASGATVGLLVLPLDLETLNRRISGPWYEGGLVVVTDSRNHVLLRTLDFEKRVGQPAPPRLAVHLVEQARRGAPYHYSEVGVEGVQRRYVALGVPGVHWQVVAALPQEQLAAGANAALQRNAALGAILLGGALALAWWIAGVIGGPTRRLAAVAARVAEGEAGVRAAAEGPPELVQVAQQFNRMLDVRDEAEASLRASQARWQFALEGAGDGVWDWNVATAQVYFSPRWKQMLGHTDDEIGTGVDEWSSRVHPDDMAHVMPALQAHLDGRAPSYSVEFRARCKDGQWKWVLARGLVVERDSHGRALRIVGTHTDIDERRAFEDRLRTNAQLLEASQRIAKVGGWELDIASGHLFWTAETYRLHDTSPDAFNPTVDAGVGYFLPESRLRISEALKAAIERGEGYDLELETYTTQGRLISVRTTCQVSWQDGRPARLTGIFQDITEQKREQQMLRLLESGLARLDDVVMLAEAAPPGGEGPRIVYVNEAFTRLTGYAREEALGRTPRLLQGPRTEAAALDRIAAAMDQGQPVQEELVNYTQDGRALWVEVAIAPIADGQGRPSHFVVVERDITERRLTADTMQFLAQGGGPAEAGFFPPLVRFLARVLEAECVFIERLGADGRTLELVAGICDGEALVDAPRPLAGTAAETALAEGQFACSRGAGLRYPQDRRLCPTPAQAAERCEAVALRGADGTPIGAIGIASRRPAQRAELDSLLLRLVAVRAAAELERAGIEAALRESRRRYQTLVELSPNGIVVHRDGLAVYANPAALRILGAADAAEVVGRSVLERVHPDFRTSSRELIEAVLQRGEQLAREEKLLRLDGTAVDVAIQASRIEYEGRPAVQATFSDISARKQAEAAAAQLEAQLRESQKMEAVGTLASSIAHDFNNVMGAVLGNVALARDDLADAKLPPDHPALMSLAQIQVAGLRARSMVQKLMSFARRQPQQMQMRPLQPLLHEGVELLRSMLPSGVSIHASLPEAPLVANVDATQLHQLLMNLGINAWQALQGQPGTIEIGLEAVALGDASPPPDGMAAGPAAHLWVRDSGCGMAPEVLQHLFEPFFTTKPSGQGTGLGLAAVRGIAQAHDGAVGVDSVPGRGSCFHIWLPVQPSGEGPAAATDVAPETPPAVHGTGQRVLYVDDDETVRLVTQRLLERAGFRTTAVDEAAHALQLLRADPHAFDLVITDFNMPRMSGLDLAREARALRIDLPVLLTSGSVSDELLARARTVGVTALVNKERSLEDLASQALAVLAGRVAPTQA